MGLAICIIAIVIGEHTLKVGPAAVVLIPIIWAVLIGSVIGLQKIVPISGRVRTVGDPQIRVGIVAFLALLGMGIGPTLGEVANLGPAIVLQEVGHIFGTVVLALPVAVGLRMGRSAIGASWSVDRESFLAYAIERFGIRSPEYRGVFGVWIFGSIFGALYVSLIAGLFGSLDILHPLALALGLGLGSSSMMLGGVGALSVLYPAQATEIMALAGLSNLVTNIVGFYAGVFLSLPLARKLYLFWTRIWNRPDAEVEEAKLVARGIVPDGDASEKSKRSEAVVRPSASEDVLATGSSASSNIPTGPEGDASDPPEPTGWPVTLFVFGSAGGLGLLINVIGTGEFAPRQIIGTVFLIAITALSFLLAKWIPKIPASVWVLGIATLLSAPFFPYSGVLVGWVDGMDVMLFGLLQLALIGMSLGRDVQAIKQLSWKVVIIALLTLTTSFLAAAVLAQTVLHL
ncbi:DUF3100 domain-containing protein [Brevibacterium siliguriense]|uniref:DUF3100 domain-containing protein n=1 Tax=Brevibacterium siliguriense TaxID=1136497 RepID=UPI001E2DFA37|nr:DUF3100 domain-containing protein [Brevibacterium siliguriense]